MSSVGVGVIGCGLIGKKRIENLPSNCELLSVYDVNPDAALRITTSRSIPTRIEESVERMLRDESIDIVVIATTHEALASTALLAARHGKHILIEKPGGINANALREVKVVAEQANVRVHVGFNHRFHPSMLMTKELLSSEKYGELMWMRGRYGHGGRVGYEKEWRAKRSLSGGGELLDQGSHLIDLSQYLFGESQLLFSRLTTSYWQMEVEDNAFVALETGCGSTVWLHASWTEWKNMFSVEIALEKAKIEVNGLGGSYGRESLTLYEMQPEMGPPPSEVFSWESDDYSWKLEMEDFISAVNGFDFKGCTLDEALRVLEIIEKAYSM